MSFRELSAQRTMLAMAAEEAAARRYLEQAAHGHDPDQVCIDQALEAIDVCLALANDLTPRDYRRAEIERLTAWRDRLTGPSILDLLESWHERQRTTWRHHL